MGCFWYGRAAQAVFGTQTNLKKDRNGFVAGGLNNPGVERNRKVEDGYLSY